NWGTGPSDNYRGFYTVTAAYDDTVVTVKPGPIGAGVLPGVAGIDATGNGTVTLNAGDAFTIYTDGPGTMSDPQDVTGTLVEASKAVQVIGGHQCTNVPDDVTFCDHLEESMFPAQTLATSYFVTAPLIPDDTNVPKVEMVRVVATQDSTTLTYDPPLPGAATTIAQAGGWIDIASTSADFRVKADKPVSVAQYMEGQSAGGGAGDPALALTVSESQYRNSYLIHAPTAYPTNFVNIIAPSSATVTVDGATIAAARFQAIGGTGYSVIRMPLSNEGNGNHTITGSKPVGVTVYGYGQVTSYWYPGGLNLNDLSRPGGVDH
ncbi:MAG TPA: IgGFc-binding protein, partial [Polyangiaceae bacterium]|nr:IgGFc-binding protein [Polyangiaceae bacterium]